MGTQIFGGKGIRPKFHIQHLAILNLVHPSMIISFKLLTSGNAVVIYEMPEFMQKGEDRFICFASEAFYELFIHCNELAFTIFGMAAGGDAELIIFWFPGECDQANIHWKEL